MVEKLSPSRFKQEFTARAIRALLPEDRELVFQHTTPKGDRFIAKPFAEKKGKGKEKERKEKLHSDVDAVVTAFNKLSL